MTAQVDRQFLTALVQQTTAKRGRLLVVDELIVEIGVAELAFAVLPAKRGAVQCAAISDRARGAARNNVVLAVGGRQPQSVLCLLYTSDAADE